MTEAVTDRTRAVADPVGLIVDLLTYIDGDFDPVVARQIVMRIAPHRAKVRRLAFALSERPNVLQDGKSPAPLIVATLILAVRAAGAHKIGAPICTTCQRPIYGSTVARIGENWFCHSCGSPRELCVGCRHERAVGKRDRHGRPYCIHCPLPEGREPIAVLVEVITALDPGIDVDTITEAIHSAAPGPTAQRHLAWAIEEDPDLLTGQGYKAALPSVLRLIDALCDVGDSNIVRPACPGCGRIARLSHCHGGQRVCRRCIIIQRSQSCSRCGKTREPAGRDEHGHPLCSRCVIEDSSNHEECIRCGQRRPVHARTTDGPFCASCRPKRTMTCHIYGRTGEAVISLVTGEPWCRACQQRWSRCVECGQVKPVRSGTTAAPVCSSCTGSSLQPWRACPRCGVAEQLGYGPCERCVLTERLNQLLSDDTGTVAPELRLLQRTLAATERPATVMYWLDQSAAHAVLGELARHERPLTHSAIDELTPSKPVEHLRSVLVSTGALPERDEQLVRTERWVTETIASCPDPARRQLLHTYAHWHLLRRLRTWSVPAFTDSESSC